MVCRLMPCNSQPSAGAALPIVTDESRWDEYARFEMITGLDASAPRFNCAGRFVKAARELEAPVSILTRVLVQRAACTSPGRGPELRSRRRADAPLYPGAGESGNGHLHQLLSLKNCKQRSRREYFFRTAQAHNISQLGSSQARNAPTSPAKF